MLFELPFASLVLYAKNAPGDRAKNAIMAADRVKTGDAETLERITGLLEERRSEFTDVLGSDRLLVPIPRSSITSKDTFWPTERICTFLRKGGFGSGLLPILRRKEKITASKLLKGSQRHTPERHIETMACQEMLLPTDKITLVDDIVSTGSTALGAASVLSAYFPNVEVRLFAIFRTVSFRKTELAQSIEPVHAVIKYSTRTLQAYRTDN